MTTLNSKQAVLDRFGVDEVTLSAADVVPRVKALSRAVPTPATLLVLRNGEKIADGDYVLDTLVVANDAIKPADAGKAWAAGDVFTLIYDKTLFTGLKALMDRAKAAGKSPEEDKGFADLTIELHKWASAELADVFGAVDAKLLEIDTAITTMKAAFNSHTHNFAIGGIPDGAGGFTTANGSTGGPSTGM